MCSLSFTRFLSSPFITIFWLRNLIFFGFQAKKSLRLWLSFLYWGGISLFWFFCKICWITWLSFVFINSTKLWRQFWKAITEGLSDCTLTITFLHSSAQAPLDVQLLNCLLFQVNRFLLAATNFHPTLRFLFPKTIICFPSQISTNSYFFFIFW